MKMQIQTKGQCMIYALAMVIDTPASTLLQECEYKGDGKRSLHIQELMDLLIPRQLSLVTVEVDPYCTDPVYLTQERVYAAGNNRIMRYMRIARGIALVWRNNMQSHSVAWDGTHVYDPKGYITEGIPDGIYAFLRLVEI